MFYLGLFDILNTLILMIIFIAALLYIENERDKDGSDKLEK